MDAYSTGKRKFLAQLRVTRKQLISIKQTYYFAIPSKPVASPYESRSAPKNGIIQLFLFCMGIDAYSTSKRKFLARLRVTRKQLNAIGQTYYFAIPSKPEASLYSQPVQRRHFDKTRLLTTSFGKNNAIVSDQRTLYLE